MVQRVAALGSLLAMLACSEVAPRSEMAPYETWELVEAVRIGSAAGAAYPLQRVLGLLPAPDGSVLVRQVRSHEVPVFSGDGRLLRVVGRKGEGPGEYLSIDSMGWLADTLWIGDWRLRRISYHLTHGEFLSDARYEVAGLGTGLTSTAPFHMSRSWAATHPAVRVQVMDQIGLPILKTDRAGRILDTLSVWDRSELMVRVARGDRENPLFRPFLGMEHAASSPSGSFMALLEPVVEPSRDTVTAILKVWDESGRRVLDRVLTRVSTPVPDSLRSAWLEEESNRATPDSRAAAEYRRELASTVDIPTRFGFGDALFVSDEGQIWIRLISGGENRQWWIMNADGQLLAQAVLPAETDLIAVGPYGVWGVLTDDLGVNYIVRFDIINRG